MVSFGGIRTGGAPAGSAASRALDERLDTIGWGLLFLLIGALALPAGIVEFASVAGVGALLLALNGARVAVGIRVSWFSVILGVTALTAGLAAIAGLPIDLFVLFFGLAGLVTIGGAVLRSDVRSPSDGGARDEPSGSTS